MMRYLWLFVAFLMLVALSGTPRLRDQAAAKENQSRLERGKYLIAVAGCQECHTPWSFNPKLKHPVPDMTRILSGHPSNAPLPKTEPAPGEFAGTSMMTAWRGPWGVTFSANLTPDKETGIGSWTEDEFIRTLRTGKHRGDGRAILPPMPVESTGAMTSDDLKAIFAYLRSLPPIKNKVPDPVPPSMGQKKGSKEN